MKLTPLFLALAVSAACGSEKAGPAKATQVTEDYLAGLNGAGLLETAYRTNQAFGLAGPEACDYVLSAYDGIGELGKQLNALPPKPPGLDQCVTQVSSAVTAMVEPFGDWFAQGLPPCSQFPEVWSSEVQATFEKGLCALRRARDVCAGEATAAKATTKLDDARFCAPAADGPSPSGPPPAAPPAPAPPPP